MPKSLIILNRIFDVFTHHFADSHSSDELNIDWLQLGKDKDVYGVLVEEQCANNFNLKVKSIEKTKIFPELNYPERTFYFLNKNFEFIFIFVNSSYTKLITTY